MLNANQIIGTHDVLFVTLDTLRYDVAAAALARGLRHVGDDTYSAELKRMPAVNAGA